MHIILIECFYITILKIAKIHLKLARIENSIDLLQLVYINYETQNIIKILICDFIEILNELYLFFFKLFYLDMS